jgi:CubicO group peptidase (beta-lactamase class C family)
MTATRRALHAYVQALVEAEGFSGTALVARRHRSIFSRADGMTSVEHPHPITMDTVFRIGSLTKPITATAILQLHDQRRLSIRDRVHDHRPDCPAAWADITLHQLLTHTSGIPSFTALPDYASFMARPSTAWETLRRVRHLPLDFAPGTQFAYSNSGYVLLGAIIEAASGQTYGARLRDAIFAPLKMRRTAYGPPSPAARQAVGYELDEDRAVPARAVDTTVAQGAGGLVSTAGDLRRFVAALCSGRLLTPEAHRIMVTPGRARYGCGVRLGRVAGHPSIWHNGGIAGFSSNLTYMPDESITVVLLSNRESGAVDDAARDLAAIALGERPDLPIRRVTMKVNADVLRGHQGDYDMGAGRTLTVTEADGRLLVQMAGQEPFAASALSEAEFWLRAVHARLTFVCEEGRTTGVRLRQQEQELSGVKLDVARNAPHIDVPDT